jgi:hypothetical protein
MTECKCCDGVTRAFARLDFSRSCGDAGTPPFAPSGEMVPYIRCERCGFIFTRHFDSWSPAQMAERIYNEDYHLADPDFADARPAGFAGALSTWLKPLKGQIATLDYGGGNGMLAATMRQAGYNYDSYDPYFAKDTAPAHRYDLVSSFEVVEHTPDPLGTFKEMFSYVSPDGAVLFSTQLQPPEVTPGWWYIAPRNGHISIYTARSLQYLAVTLGVRFLTLGDGIHLMYRRAADPVALRLLSLDVHTMLWHASRQNARALLATSLTVAQLGHPFAALDPRHAARLFLGERRPARSGVRQS